MSEILGVCDNYLGSYHQGVHIKRNSCRHFVSADEVNKAREERAKIDRERGIYSQVQTKEPRGFCLRSLTHPHPKYTLCEGWFAVGTNLTPAQDFQKDLHSYKISMGVYPPGPNSISVHPMEPETPVEPKKGGYATLMTPRECNWLGVFPPETDEEREARRNREFSQAVNAAKTPKKP